MEKLISSRCNLQSVPESYILPPERRPGELIVPLCNTIPVIDLHGEFGCNRSELIQQIIKSSQEFGFFQLVNHGVSVELMRDVLIVAKKFFELPAEDKASLYSEDPKQCCRLYTSIDYATEKVHFWRDNLRHPCHPLKDHLHHWPQKPTQYREVVGRYSVEVRKLSFWLLDLIRDGLGLESGYFRDNLSQVQLMALNHYPPCPDPSLTLGLPKHSDVNLITLLNQQDVLGLQVLKDEKWLAVEPLPNAFVVNIGLMLQIISNGKLKSADHRVVTNTSVTRTTVASFIHPSSDSHIEPAKVLVSKRSPPLYRAFIYKDFVITYRVHTHEGKPPLEHLELPS
ncbi:hypothetical protein F0562_002453 [Nyssa sinensis]|uniref:Fe2OG dioxygenase domain-containing protein n=1 Tax=Nyssa sinensis TaxID=561372 RepID=A0A5J5C6H1_9ASTE|nr:hypothetical protein F0562_002453 [Nyssa sinensis]